MKKVIVTLRSATAATVDVPAAFPQRKRGKREKERAIERSVFGTLKLFPGVPRTISEDELEFLRLRRPELALEVARYVESRRVDLRGVSEAEIEELAEREGIGHLDLRRKLARLVERGKVKESTKPRTGRTIPTATESKPAEKSARKPK